MPHAASDHWDESRARAALLAMFHAAVASADPRPHMLRLLPEKPRGRCIVVGAGKASAAMASALDAALREAWPDVPVAGVVATRYGHAVPAGRIGVIEAAHPKPDASSVSAARAMLGAVWGLTADDLVIALISGGGSSLMCLPAGEMSLEDKRVINDALLRSGATIAEMNAVRKHFSAIKGGRLALAAAPARVVTLAISDVPGDDPAVIASGPTVGDATSWAEVTEILARYAIDPPPAARAVMAAGRETPKPDAVAADVRMVATPAMALRAAAETARAQGVTPLTLGDALEGEAREMGVVLAGIARSAREHGAPGRPPLALLSGGEATVTIGSDAAGRGGRNTEFLLALAIAAGERGVYAIAGDSDGIDGVEQAAGAIVTPDTLARGAALGLSARDFLRAHDSYSYFERLGDLVVTGPTLTNVNDIRAILVV